MLPIVNITLTHLLPVYVNLSEADKCGEQELVLEAKRRST